MAPKAHIGYLYGYGASNIYRICVPALQKVLRTRDVVFDESTMYDPPREELGIPIFQDARDVWERLELPILAQIEEDQEVLTS